MIDGTAAALISSSIVSMSAFCVGFALGRSVTAREEASAAQAQQIADVAASEARDAANEADQRMEETAQALADGAEKLAAIIESRRDQR